MLNLRRLGTAVFVASMLGVTAWADCPAPGVMGGPPCISAVQPLSDEPTVDQLTEPGTMGGSPADVARAPSVELPTLAEIALNVLTLF
jgi:hypothetical protein